MNDFGRFVGLLIALILIFTGTIILLGNFGVLAIDPFELIADLWPVLLILAGLYLIWLRLRAPHTQSEVTLSEPLNGITRADIDINFGAGELKIGAHTAGENLFEGSFASRPDKSVSRKGGLATVGLRQSGWPFSSRRPWSGDEWNLRIADKISLSLNLNTGASRVSADLTGLRAEAVELNTGASDVTVKLPGSAGFTRALIKGGAADIKLIVPPGVAARVKSTGALSSLRVDTKRFPATEGGYASPDYGSAQNRIDIEVNTGVSSVTIS